MAEVKGIEVELKRILEDYSEDVEEITFIAVHKAALKCKRDIKAASPGSGKYAAGWTVRNKREHGLVSSIVFNRDEPQLTHLLEKSHQIKNQFGEYGRTSPGHGQVIHIAPAAEEAERYLDDLLREALGK